ncbi:MAG: tetratricopeptide repeat protein, partial [Dysgonamonadaceae bacterium]|nr:tetratricopeptide repeat protein [Dysgonamonadaceae bacterium]
AAYYYAKAIEAEANYPFGYIGEGSLALMSGKMNEAEELFKKAEGMNKKDASISVAIAEAYIEVKQYPKAQQSIEKAKKADKKYAGTFMVEGDLFRAKEENLGLAAGSYESALRLNKKEKSAYLKLAKLYEHANPKVALDYLDQLIAIDPEYIPAYALIGDINRNRGTYQQALRAYEKFISIPGVPLLQRDRYAQLLYFTDQYEKSLKEIDYVLSFEPNNVVMHRLQAYNNFKLENYETGAQQMDEFMESTPKDQHIYLDYLTYGQLLLKVKRAEDALAAFQNAAASENAKSEIHKELAMAYRSLGKQEEMIAEYEKYFEEEKNLSLVDYQNYGRGLYSLAAKFVSSDYKASPVSPEQKTADDQLFYSSIEKGNDAFGKIIESRPDHYSTLLWMARLNSLVDLKEQEELGAVMKGVAKPYYEKFVEVALSENEDGKANKDILDAYRYLASYYLLLDDKVNSGEYFKKILEIDPDNADAKTALDTMQIKY